MGPKGYTPMVVAKFYDGTPAVFVRFRDHEGQWYMATERLTHLAPEQEIEPGEQVVYLTPTDDAEGAMAEAMTDVLAVAEVPDDQAAEAMLASLAANGWHLMRGPIVEG